MQANRRRFIAMGAAAAACSALGMARAASSRTVIDVHHHLFPPSIGDYLRGKLPEFMVPGAERSLAEMDAAGTGSAVISYPASETLQLPQDTLAPMIHAANEFAISLVGKHRGRYGLFASLPLPHVDASLKEIAHVFDELRADGVMLNTSYQNRWLGYPRFAPVLEELNRRKAVAYTHPGPVDCCRNMVPGVHDSIVEFESDTARTIASLMFSGAAERWPNIRFIFSHAGGTMPALIERFRNAHRANPKLTEAMPRGAESYIKAFHYDTAQAANSMALGSLLRLVPVSQVMFGTDFPHRRTAEQLEALRGMQFDDASLDAILRGNARKLVPRLAGE
jgi:predicted TIM-barrel fold metal-dependent hydrolase